MASHRWTEEQTKQALYLYFQTPFGKIDKSNSEIIELAERLGRTPASVAMKLANFASLDPKIVESGRKGLSGASALDRMIWAKFNDDWTRLVGEAEALGHPAIRSDNGVSDNAAEFVAGPVFGHTTTMVLTEQRVGQNFFRRAVLANYENICCVTGINEPELLNASHIIPWKDDVQNRHNPKNGLCLSATFDRAFDRGFMVVDARGRVAFSKRLIDNGAVMTRAFFAPYDGQQLLSASRFDPDPSFLEWHRMRHQANF